MKLKQWRIERGWTQQQVADALEIETSNARRMVSRWEADEGDPSARLPSQKWQRRIYTLTDGAVGPLDWPETTLHAAQMRAARQQRPEEEE